MKKTFYFFALIICCGGCKEDENPDFPATPYIEFRDVDFIDLNQTDTINLTFYYRDGDLDLGMDHGDPVFNDSPYHYMDLFIHNGVSMEKRSTTPFENTTIGDATRINLLPGDEGKLVTFRTRKNPAFSSLPEHTSCRYIYPYVRRILIAEEYESMIDNPESIVDQIQLLGDSYFVLADTFYHEANKNHYNIEVDFMVKQPNGEFAEFNWESIYCLNFDGRFTQMGFGKSGPFNGKKISNWEGELTYSMMSIGFQPTFGTNKIKLRVKIRDRALNESNTIETPEFTVQ